MKFKPMVCGLPETVTLVAGVVRLPKPATIGAPSPQGNGRLTTDPSLRVTASYGFKKACTV